VGHSVNPDVVIHAFFLPLHHLQSIIIIPTGNESLLKTIVAGHMEAPL
jgi:hypothetical protein